MKNFIFLILIGFIVSGCSYNAGVKKEIYFTENRYCLKGNDMDCYKKGHNNISREAAYIERIRYLRISCENGDQKSCDLWKNTGYVNYDRPARYN